MYDQRDVQGFVKLYTLRLLPGAPAIASSGDGKAPAQGGGARFRIGFLDQTKVKSDAVRPRSATVTTPPRWANSCALPSPVT